MYKRQIYDREIAAMYAVEAIRLVDHYHFRYSMKDNTSKKPLVLEKSDNWAQSYYDENSPKYKDRELFTVHSKKRNENFQDTKAIFIEKATDFDKSASK